MRPVMNDPVRVMRTIRPSDGIVSLCCDAETAEQLWYNEANRTDRLKFVLMTEQAPHGCDIVLRVRDNINHCDEPEWLSPLIIFTILGLCIAWLIL